MRARDRLEAHHCGRDRGIVLCSDADEAAASRKCAGRKVVEAVNSARSRAPTLDWTLPASRWAQAHEDALIAGLKAVAPATGYLRDTLILNLNVIVDFPEHQQKKREWTLNRTERVGISNRESRRSSV